LTHYPNPYTIDFREEIYLARTASARGRLRRPGTRSRVCGRGRPGTHKVGVPVNGGTVEAWIMHYGYIGVVIGTFFEGETTVLLGGIFSKLDFLSIRWVILYAFTGTFLGDCTFFFVGKLFGSTLIDRYHILRSRTPYADKAIRRYGHLILFTMRFLAGFRTMILILLGCADMNIARFLVIDFFMAALWAGLLSLLGYSFGNVIYIFVTDVTRYQRLVVPVVVAVAITVILFYRYFVRRKER